MAKTNSFWDEEYNEVVLEKNIKGDEIHIKSVRKGKNNYIDVRTFYHDRETGEMLPGKGITLHEEIADDVANAILKLNQDGVDEGEENNEL